MNRFQKTVTFSAYQFDPSKITSDFGEGSVSHLVEEALGEANVEIYETSVSEDGTLTLILTVVDCDAPREMFKLSPGEWIAAQGFGNYTEHTDDEFWGLPGVQSVESPK